MLLSSDWFRENHVPGASPIKVHLNTSTGNSGAQIFPLGVNGVVYTCEAYSLPYAVDKANT